MARTTWNDLRTETVGYRAKKIGKQKRNGSSVTFTADTIFASTTNFFLSNFEQRRAVSVEREIRSFALLNRRRGKDYLVF